MSKNVDISNLVFGKLTAIKKVGIKQYPSGQTTEKWLCLCECGNELIILKKNLVSGHTKSCGCLKHKAYNYKHKLRNSRLYRIWTGLKTRCLNSNSKSYKNYGEKNINICEIWKNDFITFYEWAMSNGYTDNLSIDRIDVNGDYEPNNCRWVTNKVQARNKTTNIFYEYNGETHCLSEWAEILNLDYKKIHKRIKRGWSFEKAIK